MRDGPTVLMSWARDACCREIRWWQRLLEAVAKTEMLRNAADRLQLCERDIRP